MEDLRYKFNARTGRTTCGGNTSGYYIVADTTINPYSKPAIIPLNIYSDLRHVIERMMMHNGSASNVYLWVFRESNDIDTQRCYYITKEEIKLYRTAFPNKIVTKDLHGYK